MRLEHQRTAGQYRRHFRNRQFHARRNLVAMDEEETGETIIVPSVIPRLSETPGQIRQLGPKLESTEKCSKICLA